jgi:hypothetical protein
MSTLDWQSQFESEMQQASKARAAGNEGMARVCARRAAGIVIGEYFRRSDRPLNTPSAYDRLKQLSRLPGVPAPALEAASHLAMRVTLDFKLPVEADLLADARRLRQELLDE